MRGIGPAAWAKMYENVWTPDRLSLVVAGTHWEAREWAWAMDLDKSQRRYCDTADDFRGVHGQVEFVGRYWINPWFKNARIADVFAVCDQVGSKYPDKLRWA